MFAGWGRFVYRRRRAVLGASLLSLVAAVLVVALGLGGELKVGEFEGETEAGRAIELLQRELPARPPSFTLVFSSDALSATDPAFRAEMLRALQPLRHAPQIAAVRTPYDATRPVARMISTDGKSAFATVELRDGSDAKLQDTYASLRGQVRSDKLEVLGGGSIAANRDFNHTAERDLRRAELVSLPLALLMLLLVFGSLVATGLPLGVGALAVAGGFAGTLLLARFTDVSIYATNIVTMIGLGVAIDYSLFIVSRFREEVRRLPVRDALAATLATAGRAVVFSGLTVAIGLAGLMFFSLGNIGSMGLAGTIVVALAVVYALTLLPALLALAGPRVNSLRVPFIHPERAPTGRGVWHNLARAVMARPWWVLVPVVVLLLGLGVPALGMQLGGGDITMLPETSEARRAAELLRTQFPGGDTNPVTVVLRYPEGSPLTPERIGQMYDTSRRLAELPHVSRVESVVDLDPSIPREGYQRLLSAPATSLPPQVASAVKQSVGKHVATLTAYTPAGPDSDEVRDLVRAARRLPPPSGGELLVTGQAAYNLDYVDAIAENAPRAVAFIVLATYVVLFLLLGSLLLPLKAVLMNFLSISASYGALVWIFQQGHLSGLLNFTPGAIEASTPVLMFCILFGLSMDYEVLLLSRVKEEWERTGDNTHAVAHSLERTGRLITGAAAIMAVVFFSFGLAQTVIIKAIGLGMGIAVVLDATVIRALLVPATMRLLGRWNWWAPRPLARLYHKLNLGERSADAPEVQRRTEMPPA
jgi:RND superfamily putative drug exporter